ncbi:MAG: hypothetical protein HRU34_13890 [Richelia sp.]|nr:hypothetical protein [Richelia sp.]CDN11748.1 hypothetical protein RintRC_4285 [Richelia intracellularis]
MSKLGVKVIKTVKVYGRQSGSSSTLWTEEFILESFAEETSEFVKHNISENANKTSAKNYSVRKYNTSQTENRSRDRRSSQSSDYTFNIQNTCQDALEGLKVFLTNLV